MKQYGPISCLSFIFKASTEEQLEYNDFHDSSESSYGRYHSTEIRILKVHSDILDEGAITTLIILDLSATFDVVDYPIQLKRLYGTKKALTYIK